MAKLKKHWGKVFWGSIIILYLVMKFIERLKVRELTSIEELIALIIYILIFVLDGIITFDKKHKIISSLSLGTILFIGIKSIRNYIKVINTKYSDEILRMINISDSINLLRFIIVIYFVRLSVLDLYKKKHPSDNEIDYKVIEKYKE